MDSRQRTIAFGAAGAVLGLLVGIGVGLVVFGGDGSGATSETLAPLASPVTSAIASTAPPSPDTAPVTSTDAPLAVGPSDSTTLVPGAPTTTTAVTLNNEPCKGYVENSSFPLRKCDSGPLVLELQMNLEAAGYAVDPDGYFGVGTQSAVAAHQSKSGQPVTGTVDQETFDELASLYSDY